MREEARTRRIRPCPTSRGCSLAGGNKRAGIAGSTGDRCLRALPLIFHRDVETSAARTGEEGLEPVPRFSPRRVCMRSAAFHGAERAFTDGKLADGQGGRSAAQARREHDRSLARYYETARSGSEKFVQPLNGLLVGLRSPKVGRERGHRDARVEEIRGFQIAGRERAASSPGDLGRVFRADI